MEGKGEAGKSQMAGAGGGKRVGKVLHTSKQSDLVRTLLGNHHQRDSAKLFMEDPTP